MNYRRYQWKLSACVSRTHRSTKKLKGQHLQCQLANEDDLKKKCHKEIILGIVFIHKNWKHVACVLRN